MRTSSGEDKTREVSSCTARPVECRDLRDLVVSVFGDCGGEPDVGDDSVCEAVGDGCGKHAVFGYSPLYVRYTRQNSQWQGFQGKKQYTEEFVNNIDIADQEGREMKLSDAIYRLSQSYINSLQHGHKRNTWYKWRRFDTSKLPVTVSLPNGGSEYENNVALKKELHKEWCRGDDKQKEEIVRWYISVWGGVRGNLNQTIKSYANTDPTNLIALGKKGIASWSKALCIYDPDNYAIFDARVSASLNAMQILSVVTQPILFPALSSQNKAIVSGNKFIESYAKDRKWKVIGKDLFYQEYLGILKGVMSCYGPNSEVSLSTIEMFIFAFAENLLENARTA